MPAAREPLPAASEQIAAGRSYNAHPTVSIRVESAIESGVLHRVGRNAVFGISLMFMTTEHLRHLICCPAQAQLFPQIGICQRLGKEPGTAAQNQVRLLRQADTAGGRCELPAVGLLIVGIVALNGMFQSFLRDASFEN